MAHVTSAAKLVEADLQNDISLVRGKAQVQHACMGCPQQRRPRAVWAAHQPLHMRLQGIGCHSSCLTGAARMHGCGLEPCCEGVLDLHDQPPFRGADMAFAINVLLAGLGGCLCQRTAGALGNEDPTTSRHLPDSPDAGDL